MDWNDFKYLLTLYRCKHLMAAAEQLDVNHGTVSRKITALEEKLGLNLFIRSKVGHEATEDGMKLIKKAIQMESIVDESLQYVESVKNEIKGELIITTPPGVVNIIKSLIFEYQKIHPGIEVSFILTNKCLKLEKNSAHIAIRPSKKPEELDYISKKLCIIEAGLYASESYIEKFGKIKNEKSYKGHKFIRTPSKLAHIPIIKWMCANIPNTNILYRTNLFSDIASSVIAGQGIGPMLKREAIQHKSLVEVIAPKKVWQNDLHLVYHMNLKENLKIKDFVNFLVTNFKSC